MRSLISVIALLATAFAVAALPSLASAKVDPDTVVSCSGRHGEPTVKWSVLKGPRVAETKTTAAAAALRKAIRVHSLPRSGWFKLHAWRQVGADLIQYAHGPMIDLTTITLSREDGAENWKFSGGIRGYSCAAYLLTASGDVASSWYPVPDKLPTDPAARSVRIAINIQGCEREDRVFVDAIKYTKTEVKIRAGFRPYINPDFACPTIVRPPTEYEVVLPRPIGNRAIVDIARVAPRTRASAKQLASVRAGTNPLEVLLFHKSIAMFCKDSDPRVYTVKPTQGQVSRWKARHAKYCPKQETATLIR